MKINKAKLLVGTLAIAAVAATVGSISGTVAWFQYNTRATVSYTGASAHCTENLQVRIYDSALVGSEKKYASASAFTTADPSWAKWTTDLKMADITAYIKAARGSYANSTWTDATDSGLYPVTSQELAVNSFPGTMYRSPIRGFADKTKWKTADLHDYVDIPLQFRVLDIDGNEATTETYLAKKVYLSDLTIASKAVDGKKDITDAIRVAFDGATNKATYWHGAAQTSVNVYGPLDLGGEEGNDKVFSSDDVVRLPYDFDSSADLKEVVYGDSGKTAVAQGLTKESLETPTNVLIADDSDPYSIKGKELFTAASATGTPEAMASKTDWTTMTVRIYLEGWQALKVGSTETKSALWNDKDYVGAAVNIGMTFSAEAHEPQSSHKA
jgi:hypothetical protein